jgi:integral membrane protein
MKDYKWLKIAALFEGTSLIVLLFVALPFKYYLGMPEVVKVVGMVHGALFLVFISLLLVHLVMRKVNLLRFIVGFVASFIPFGTFVYKAKCLKSDL